jgi:hypothetical protein
MGGDKLDVFANYGCLVPLRPRGAIASDWPWRVPSIC